MHMPVENQKLKWDADNRWFVLDTLLESMTLSEADKQVIRWAYNSDSGIPGKTFEQVSDGETGVRDKFINGVIKSIAGVGHDYINRVKDHTTPDGHKWSVWESNNLYLRIKKAEGAGFRHRWRRFLGITFSAAFGCVVRHRRFRWWN